jgi:hypothetical protein
LSSASRQARLSCARRRGEGARDILVSRHGVRFMKKRGPFGGA